MWREFRAFLVRQNVIALAIAFIVGAATTQLVQALVQDFIMPVVEAMIPFDRWEQAVLTVGAVTFRVGHFFGALLNFVIILFVAWRLMLLLMRQPEERPGSTCPFCRQPVDPAATRCAHCTSPLAAAA